MRAAAGVEIPSEMSGYNLIPVLKSGEPTPRKEVLGEGFPTILPMLIARKIRFCIARLSKIGGSCYLPMMGP